MARIAIIVGHAQTSTYCEAPGEGHLRVETKQIHKLSKGKAARVIVTMGMPGFVYRWLFGAHAIKIIERNIFRLVG